MDLLAALVVSVVLVDQLLLPRPAGAHARRDLRHAGGVAAVMGLALPIGLALDAWLLQPFGLAELRLLVLAAALAGLTALSARYLRDSSPATILVSASLLTVALLAARPPRGPAAGVLWAAGVGVAFVACTALFSELRDRVAIGDAPTSAKGIALALVSAGIFALGLTGLASIIRS